MSSPGWYPDPAGDPDLQRYWDGSGWSSQTRPVDRSAPEGPSAWPELEQQQAEAWAPLEARPRRRTGLVVALVVLAVVVVGGGVAAAVTVGRHDSAGPSPDDGPTTASTASASPTVSSTAVPIVNDCPDADSTSEEAHTKDGRVHGGGLSFPHQPGSTWRGYDFHWADDAQGEMVPLKGSWGRFYAVGRLPAWSGYTSLQRAAETLLSCIAHDEDMYAKATRFVPAYSRATKVDGDDAWEARGSVYVDDAPYRGGTVHVVVVDTGGKGYSAFMGDAPIGVKPDLEALDRALKDLHVDH